MAGHTPARRRTSGLVVVPVEVVIWWALLVGVWVLTLSSAPPWELYIAAAAALPCAALVPVVRRTIGAAWRPDPRWLRWLLVLPIAILADTARIFTALLVHVVTRRPLDGELQEVRLRPHGDPRRAAAHRALGTVTLSSTPGSFVVDTRPEDDVLIVHSLVDGPPSLDAVIAENAVAQSGSS